MTKNEKNKLLSYLLNCKNYFEYGCGNSTIMASKVDNIKNIVVVESCLNWISKTSSSIDYKNKNIIFNFVDIESDESKWGWPKNKNKISNWPVYSEVINKYNMDFDLILVDGRFRVACSFMAHIKMKSNSHLIVHDYLRPEYYLLENYFKKIEQIDTLAVFQKIEIPIEEIKKEYEKFKLIIN